MEETSKCTKGKYRNLPKILTWSLIFTLVVLLLGCMAITLGSNIQSLRTQRQLFNSGRELESVFTRLSSGQRINKASDDAAGLAIADSLNVDSRVFTQGVRNLNDGLSVLNTADGALEQLTDITIRLKELAEQAANGTLGANQRRALDEEAQELSDEYFRIVQTTEFSGRRLFDAEFGELRLQAGYGIDGSIGQGLGGAVGTGEFGGGFGFGNGEARFPSFAAETRTIESTDINGDGNLDIVVADYGSGQIMLQLGNGEGGFTEEVISTNVTGPSSLALGDFDGDGVTDIAFSDYNSDEISILIGNGDGSFEDEVNIATGTPTPVSLASGDLDNDGLSDLVMTNEDGQLFTLYSNGNGSFESSQIGSPAPDMTQGLELADIDNDGRLDILAANSEGSSEVYTFLSNGERGYSAGTTVTTNEEARYLAVGDINGDGNIDFAGSYYGANSVDVYLGNGDGTFQSGAILFNSNQVGSVDIGDVNGDGFSDIVTTAYDGTTARAFLGNGSGQFNEVVSSTIYGEGSSATLADFNNDGVLDIATNGISGTEAQVNFGRRTDGVSPLLEFSLTSIVDAKEALSQFTNKLDQLSTQRGEIGAFQARLQAASSVLGVSTENYKSAESRIRDADIALETANLTRLNILQQSGAAVLSQANQQPALAIQLLS